MISLASGIRANLIDLQAVSDRLNATQARLGSGKKVDSPIDNPTAFFTAYGLTVRAAEFSSRLDGIAKGIKTLDVASSGIAAITALLKQAGGIARGARALSTAATNDRSTSASEFNRLLRQVDQIAKDSSYDGVNLLRGDSLLVEFGGRAGSANANLEGFDAYSGGSVVVASDQTAGTWISGNSAIDSAITAVETSIANLDRQTSAFRSDLSILTTRKTFTQTSVDNLGTAAAELTNADLQAETATVLTLSARQRFALNAVSLASQSAQLVLRLLQ